MYMHNLCMHIHKHFVYLSVSFKSVEADGLSVCYCNSTFFAIAFAFKGKGSNPGQPLYLISLYTRAMLCGSDSILMSLVMLHFVSSKQYFFAHSTNFKQPYIE